MSEDNMTIMQAIAATKRIEDEAWSVILWAYQQLKQSRYPKSELNAAKARADTIATKAKELRQLLGEMRL